MTLSTILYISLRNTEEYRIKLLNTLKKEKREEFTGLRGFERGLVIILDLDRFPKEDTQRQEIYRKIKESYSLQAYSLTDCIEDVRFRIEDKYWEKPEVTKKIGTVLRRNRSITVIEGVKLNEEGYVIPEGTNNGRYNLSLDLFLLRNGVFRELKRQMLRNGRSSY